MTVFIILPWRAFAQAELQQQQHLPKRPDLRWAGQDLPADVQHGHLQGHERLPLRTGLQGGNMRGQNIMPREIVQGGEDTPLSIT